jgi:hypothetical protein
MLRRARRQLVLSRYGRDEWRTREHFNRYLDLGWRFWEGYIRCCDSVRTIGERIQPTTQSDVFIGELQYCACAKL